MSVNEEVDEDSCEVDESCGCDGEEAEEVEGESDGDEEGVDCAATSIGAVSDDVLHGRECG